MMEQLAERRMQREEEAQYAASGLGHPSQHAYSNHPPDDDDFEEDDEDEYDSQEDYDEDDDEMESMTEEQRMEEGRRMFQIFAARMFEQRVLTAYKEKVAEEKAKMLLAEQEEEEKLAEERKAKKARDAQKKKLKKDQQKLAKAEEKAKKDAEKAREEAAAKAAEEKKQEEQRKKKEEQRKKKEVERKAQEEEKQRKEAERLKRQHEERERQQEAERKAREQKAQEKKAKEEVRRKQREEQEAKEREAKEKKAQEEKEKKERESKAKAEREAAVAAAVTATATNTTKSVQPQPVAMQKRASQQTNISAPPGLRGSPQIAPALPKAPTPAGRQRQVSQPVSHVSSPGNPQPGSTNTTGLRLGSPTNTTSHPANMSSQQTAMPKTILTKGSTAPGAGLPSGRTQPSSPIQPSHQDPTHGSPFGQPFPMSPFSGSQPPGIPISNQRPPMAYPQQGIHQPFPQHASSFQPFPLGGSMRGHPPGMGAPGMPPFGRGPPLETPPGLGQPMPNFPSQFPPTANAATAPIGPPGHSRTSSASIDKSPLDGIGASAHGHYTSRPGPVQRPSSTKPHPDLDRPLPHFYDESVDEMAQKMGSASLGGDEDDPISASNSEARGGGMPFGPPHPPTPGFGISPLVSASGSHGFGSLNGLPSMSNNWHSQGLQHSNVTTPSWASSPNPNNLWSTGPGGANGPPTSFGGIGPGPATLQNPRDRLRQLRVNVCRICRHFDNNTSPASATNPTAPSSSSSAGPADGFHDLDAIVQVLNTGLAAPHAAPVSRNDVVEILDTLGDAQNGGGSFLTRQEGERVLVKYENDTPVYPHLHHGGGGGGGGHGGGVGGAQGAPGAPGTGGQAAVGAPLAGLGPIASPVQQQSSLMARGNPAVGSMYH
ncbi:MAG: Stress response protein nst1 [Bathelium mastoideum]|nr:MAG: Stress response protein nst1 [Bathelium mastoideum]